MTQVEKREWWEQVIELQRESQVSVAEFCRHEGIKEHQFYYWKRRLSPKPQERKRQPFVPLEFLTSQEENVASGIRNCGITVISGSTRLELAKGFDGKELLRVLQLVGGAGC